MPIWIFTSLICFTILCGVLFIGAARHFYKMKQMRPCFVALSIATLSATTVVVFFAHR